MRRSSLIVCAWLLLAVRASALLVDLVPVEHPSLEAMERSVANQLAAARQRLDDALAVAGVVDGRLVAPDGDAGAHATERDALAIAFGDLGALYLVYDLIAPARACLENAARLRPTEARWPHLLGSLHEHDRSLAEARRWYERAASIDPAYLPSRLRLAGVLAVGGEDGRAREVFAGVLDDAPTGSSYAAAAEAGLGRLALVGGDPRAAIGHLERALAMQPQAAALHYVLARAYGAAGDEERARVHLARRGETDVGFPDPFTAEVRAQATGVGAELVLARAALRRGDLAEAEVRARRAVALDPSSSLAQRSLGDVLARAGRLEDARQAFREAVRLAPDDVELRGSLAAVLERLGRDAEIVEVLDPVVAAGSDLASAQAALGGALARLGDDARAQSHLARAVALDPGDLAARAALARVYGRQGRYLEAAAEQARVVDGDPSSAEAHLLLATARILGGLLADAIAGLERALELHPRDPRIADVLARVLATASDPGLRDGARALELASRAYASAPSPDIGETLAMALAENGRFDEAAALAERALAARGQQGPSGNADAAGRSRRWLASYRRAEAVREPWND